MKKQLSIALATLMTCVVLTACTKAPVDDSGVVLEPTASPTATVTVTQAPVVTPDPSPAASIEPTVTPDVMEEADVIDAGFDSLYKAVDYVLIGTITETKGEWNQIRDFNDMSKPHASLFMMDKQYTIVVDEVLKSKKEKSKALVSVKDKLTLSLPYREKMNGDKDYKMLTFQEPTLNSQMLFFLQQDPDFKDVYYAEVEPHSFLIKDGKLFTFGNNVKLVDTWAKGAGKNGISLASAKKEMGIK